MGADAGGEDALEVVPGAGAGRGVVGAGEGVPGVTKNRRQEIGTGDKEIKSFFLFENNYLTYPIIRN